MSKRSPALEAARTEALEPSTPVARLLALTDRALHEVLRNPAWPLLLLEDPNLWGRLPGPAQRRLIASSKCPAAFAEWVLLQTQPVWQAEFLALNESLPVGPRRAALLRWGRKLRWKAKRPVLARLLTDDEAALLERAGIGGETAPLAEADFEALAGLGPLGRSLAKLHPDCPGPLLEALLSSEGLAQAELHVLRNPRLDRLRLAEALGSGHRSTYAEALQNPSLHREQFEEAMVTRAWRPYVAANVALPADLQVQLAADPSVEEALRRNPSLTDEAWQVIRAREPSGSPPRPVRRR